MNSEVQCLLRQMVQVIIDNTRNMGGLDDEQSQPEIDRVVSAYASKLRFVSPEEEQAANLRHKSAAELLALDHHHGQENHIRH